MGLKNMALAVAVAVGLLVAQLAEAQQPRKIPHIGFQSSVSANAVQSRLEAFRLGLRELGWVEGQSITIDYRLAEGRNDRLPGLAEELVRLKVDVIVTHGVVATLAARRATSVIPIVFASADDAVAAGLVASLARPGGNVTGLTVISPELSGKRLELLREVIPRMKRLAVLRNPTNPVSVPELKETQVAAQSLGLLIQSLEVTDPGGFAGAFSAMTREQAGALIVLSDAMFTGRHGQIVDHAAKSRLPAVYWTREFVDAGGLMSYGPNYADLYRRAATYVDKILKGAKPADLPVEQPTKFELFINLKTAKALRLTIPHSLLIRAERLIQ
jgi:putative ABC transport system substrate-binding protein